MYVETSNKAHSITSPVLSPISTPSVSRQCVGSSPGRGLLLIGLSLCRFGPAEVGWSLNCQQWSFLHASTKMLLWSLALYVQYHQECLWPWCLIPCMTQTTMPPPGSPIPSPAKCSSSTSTFQKNMLNLSEILQATADLLHYSMCIWPLCNPVQKANLCSVTWGTQKGLWHPVKKKYIYITFAIAVMSISIVANKEVWSKELEVAKTSPCELNRQLKSSQITLLVMFKGNFSFIKTYQVGTCSLVIFFPEVRDAGDLSYSHLQFFLSGVTWNLGFVLLLCEHFPACFSETFPWQWIAPTVMSFGLFPSLGFFWPAAGLAHLGKVTSWDQCVQDGSFWVPWWCQVCLGLNLNSQLLAVPSYNFTTGDLFSPLLDSFFVLSWIFYKIFTICFV